VSLSCVVNPSWSYLQFYTETPQQFQLSSQYAVDHSVVVVLHMQYLFIS